jgi:hypothetical protein
MNLIEVKQRGWSVKDHINSQLRNHRRDRDCYQYRRQTLAQIERKRADRKQFALLFAQCVRDQDSVEALDLINKYRSKDISLDFSGIFCSVFNENLFQCADCSDYFLDHEYHNVQDDFGVCNHCVNNYYWSERNNYYSEHSDDDEDEDREYENIGDRHSSKHELDHIPSLYDQRKPRVLLGLELEMEIDGAYDLDERAGLLLSSLGRYQTPSDNYLYALCEDDCSINRGFELVTAYTGLDVHAKQLEFFDTRFKGAKSHNTDTCGLHVHICKSSMTTLHASKMVLFINDPANHNLVFALARRDESSYCKIYDKKSDKSWIKNALLRTKRKDQIQALNPDRYEALNFQNEKTVEFRLFKGTLKYSTIMACLEFTFATWHFCKNASTSQLTTAGFLDFVCLPENRKDTKFLRSYLREKGFVLPMKLELVKPANQPAVEKQLAVA